MDGREFRDEVRRTFGPNLERATPANVRAFVAGLNRQWDAHHSEGERYVIDGTGDASLETGVRLFLDGLLDEDAEPARQRLWVALLELWFAILETEDEERLAALFEDLEP